MSLQHQLDDYAASAALRVAPARIATAARDVAALRQSLATRRLPGRGDRAPPLQLDDCDGKAWRLADALAGGAVVLVFYRGGWCPYCNLTLRAWQASLDALRAAGASVVALSPEPAAQAKLTRLRNQLDFVVLHDAGLQAARAWGLVHPLSPEMVEHYRAAGVELPTLELPLAATLVIEPLGSVLLSHVDADHRRRLDPAEALAVLPRRR